MTRTAAIALPQQRTAAQLLAAELRFVTVATHRLHRHQLVLDNVTVAIQRGEVMSVLSRHDTGASKLLDVLDGRWARWIRPSVGHELTRSEPPRPVPARHDHIARVLPCTASTRDSPSGRTSSSRSAARVGQPTRAGSTGWPT